MEWEDKDKVGVDRWIVLRLVTHVMVTKGMYIALLKNEMTKNHDGHH